ncbi:alpha/beta hydrolase [Denitrobaculum tricleocarpae]|uniref:Alpha/beta hydrolase n=1 Tax=Denitrobaculum tricleocarpae TaxID=2591009 RepID=A0A545TR78_9PROT|nr:alpha/beta hydrolase [Denitrobaculum tricleocarpae]TQV79724.1 alpha/beta hydrolase [Denitrobaculum tricleocarpae]
MPEIPILEAGEASTGPVLFGGYDQTALDAQYNNRAAVPDFADIVAGWQRDSERTRSELKGHLDVAYGAGDRAKLDIFPAAGDASGQAPVLVFIHGGYWQALDKSVFSCVAPHYVEAGITVVTIGYPLCPDVSMGGIVAHCRTALLWLSANIGDYGCDPTRIFLSGHSAGGHLSALLASTDWAAEGGAANLLKGAIPLSGLYELEPIRLSYLNEALHLTPEDARLYAPRLQTGRISCPLLLAVGGDETDEFLRQQRDFAAHLGTQGLTPQTLELEGLNHFTLVDALRSSGSVLSNAIVDFIQQP